MQSPFPPIRFPLFCLVLLTGGCASGESQRRAEDTAVRKDVAAEMTRICALPEGERQAEIERVKRESGLVIVCPNKP